MGQKEVAPVFGQYIDKVTDKKGIFYNELAIYPELSLFYAGFNTMKPPFNDINIRKAFCHAFNKERIVKLIMKGINTKADGILPPGMPGYNEGLLGLDYDVAKAKNLIASSDFSAPEAFSINSSTCFCAFSMGSNSKRCDALVVVRQR